MNMTFTSSLLQLQLPDFHRSVVTDLPLKSWYKAVLQRNPNAVYKLQQAGTLLMLLFCLLLPPEDQSRGNQITATVSSGAEAAHGQTADYQPPRLPLLLLLPAHLHCGCPQSSHCDRQTRQQQDKPGAAHFRQHRTARGPLEQRDAYCCLADVVCTTQRIPASQQSANDKQLHMSNIRSCKQQAAPDLLAWLPNLLAQPQSISNALEANSAWRSCRQACIIQLIDVLEHLHTKGKRGRA
jgi:hypothetical protein